MGAPGTRKQNVAEPAAFHELGVAASEVDTSAAYVDPVVDSGPRPGAKTVVGPEECEKRGSLVDMVDYVIQKFLRESGGHGRSSHGSLYGRVSDQFYTRDRNEPPMAITNEVM